MNIYDTKIVKCGVCGRHVGEVHFDASVDSAECGQCHANNARMNKQDVFFAISC